MTLTVIGCQDGKIAAWLVGCNAQLFPVWRSGMLMGEQLSIGRLVR